MIKVVAFIFLVSWGGSNACKKQKIIGGNPVVHTINLQPGEEGQDTYVSKIDRQASDGNNNLDFAKEIVMGRWNAMSGPLATFRSYLKFTGLSAIPSNASVTSAKLFLYGKNFSITFPNGNSAFPGSYNGDNTCLISRVTGGDWGESTITWNTMPSFTEVGQAKIPGSNSQWNYNAEVDVTEMVKEMVAHPEKNFGFCLTLANEKPYRSLIFASSESDDPHRRPELVVEARY